MSKIKLLILTDTYVGVPGGSERHLLNFLSLLDYNRFSVIIFQMFPWDLDEKNTEKLNNLKQVKFIHHKLQSIKSFKFFKYLYLIRKEIKKQNTDILISYHEKSDFLNFILGYLPGVNLIQVCSKRDLGFNLSGLFKRLMKLVTPRFKVFTTPSHSIKNMLETEYNVAPEHIHVIANGVDLDLYKAGTENEKIIFKSNLNMLPDSYVAVCVGSIKSVKGHEFLIRSFTQFCLTSKNDWHLIIIGIGELKKSLMEMVDKNSLKNIHFMGLQTNVEFWMRNSDLIISSSSSEGLSNALIEGIASGLPAIATDVGGTSEIIKDGYNGILVEYDNDSNLIDAFKYFDTKPEKLDEYGENSRAFAENEYANRIMVDRYQRLYATLVENKRTL